MYHGLINVSPHLLLIEMDQEMQSVILNSQRTHVKDVTTFAFSSCVNTLLSYYALPQSTLPQAHQTLLHFLEKVSASLPFSSHHEASDSPLEMNSKSSFSNGLDHTAPPKDPPPPASPKSPSRFSRRARSEAAAEARQKGPYSAVQSNGCTPPQSELKNSSGSEVEERNANEAANTAFSTDLSTGNEEEDTCPADAEIDGSNADTTDEVPSIPPATLQVDYEETSDLPNDQNDESLRPHLIENHKTSSTIPKPDEPLSEEQDKKEGNLSSGGCNGNVDISLGEGSEWFVGSVPQLNGTDEDEDFSNCILNLTSSSSKNAASGSVIEVASGSSDQITLAVMRRQRELRQLCASNHNILHRLVQAARRDLQRQEIQRRLAIADADVLEAYNKLESYKAQKRTALKRDRDFAWKTLKERQKIRAELDAFDKKPP
nr:transcriptional adapter 3 [Hymenolepis microstoma]